MEMIIIAMKMLFFFPEPSFNNQYAFKRSRSVPNRGAALRVNRAASRVVFFASYHLSFTNVRPLHKNNTLGCSTHLLLGLAEQKLTFHQKQIMIASLSYSSSEWKHPEMPYICK
jgi:hypothetical protein